MNVATGVAGANASAVPALGLAFPAPLGLAAGFDRDGHQLARASAWGFGFVEVGTVTPEPVADHNPGVAQLAQRLRTRVRSPDAIAVGVNVGVAPATAPGAAWREYAQGVRAVWCCADFIVLNFTAEAARPLRQARQRACLLDLLARVYRTCVDLHAESGRQLPVLVKWPVGVAQLIEAVALSAHCAALGYAGMVAAFTMEASSPPWESWVPVACRALTGDERARPVIAVGGVDCVERALVLREAGVARVETYRGFLSGGPELVAAINRAWRAADALRSSPSGRQ